MRVRRREIIVAATHDREYRLSAYLNETSRHSCYGFEHLGFISRRGFAMLELGR